MIIYWFLRLAGFGLNLTGNVLNTRGPQQNKTNTWLTSVKYTVSYSLRFPGHMMKLIHFKDWSVEADKQFKLNQLNLKSHIACWPHVMLEKNPKNKHSKAKGGGTGHQGTF